MPERCYPLGCRGARRGPISRRILSAVEDYAQTGVAILVDVAGENTQLVRQWFEATARRDVTQLLEIASPEIEYVPIMAVLEGRIYRGHEGIQQ
jgi:hypothetical protein